ncbi:MAG: type I-E CRISPR-associated protein Cse1/CasA [Anaerolineae bacterium]
MTFSYNLVEQPWVPCLTLDRHLVELSLAEVVRNAHQLRMLAAETPLHNVGVMTVLLALLHRVYGPKDIEAWDTMRAAGHFPFDPLEAYFARWGDRFDLFHPERPFMQALDTLQMEARPIIHLLISMANSGALFSHQTEARNVSLSVPQAVRELLAARCFRTSGPANPARKLYFSSSPYTEGILFFVEGESLFETLLLNMPVYPNEAYFPLMGNDQPSWELDDPYIEREIPFGYLDYLTWPALRVRLLPEEVNGEVRVGQAYIAPGLRLHNDILSPQKLFTLRSSKEGQKWLSLRFNEDRALWRDYDTIVSINERDGYRGLQALSWLIELANYSDYVHKRDRFRLRAMGFLADQAKPVLHRDQLLPISLTLLKSPNFAETLRRAIELAEECRQKLYIAQKELASTLLAHGGNRKPDSGDIQKQIDSWSADSMYWGRLEPLFWDWVERIPQSRETALRDWAAQLRQLTSEVFEEVIHLVGEVSGAERGAVEGQRQLNFGLKKILGDLV